MQEEKKNKKAKNRKMENKKAGSKIIPFGIDEKIMEDPEIDRLLRESLMAEADELERELNEDPKLRGVGASDDMFLSIVAKLKEMGVWEEEEESSEKEKPEKTDAPETGDSAGPEKKKGMMREDSEEISGVWGNLSAERSGKVDASEISDSAEPEKRKGMPGEDSEEISGAGENPSAENPEKMDAPGEGDSMAENTGKINTPEIGGPVEPEKRKGMPGEDSEEISGVGENPSAENPEKMDAPGAGDPAEPKKRKGMLGEDSEEISGAGENPSAGNSEKTDAPEVMKTGDPDARRLEDIYAMLPEEDLRALNLGRQIEQERSEKRKRRRKRKKIFQYSFVAASALVLVLGVSMTSEANRRFMVNMWDGLMQNLGFQVSTDYVDEKGSIRSKTKEELEAMEEIQERLGIAVIDFGYLPEGMEYQGCEIMDDNIEAIVFYSYNDKLFSVTMTDMDQEGSTYYVIDNEAVLREKTLNPQQIEVEICEANLELEEETYIAKIEYDECRYVLNGMISLEEIKKIVKNTYIL